MAVRYPTVLLDLDHTLLDSDASERAAFDNTMRTFGVAEPDDLRSTYLTLNRALWKQVEEGTTTPDHVKVERFRQLADRTAFDGAAEEAAESFAAGLGRYGDLYPDARQTLSDLSEIATLAMVTNGLSSVQRARIDRLDLAHYFGAIVISAEIGYAKPGPEIYDATFAALGNPDRRGAVMVGDSLTSDIAGGTNYGIATCWYNPHGGAATDDRITHEISRLSDLVDVIQGC